MSNTKARPQDFDILVRPVVTEKSTLGSEHGQVTFYVPVKATKPQIKEAVQNVFDVEVTGVNTVRQTGKTKRFRGKLGKRADYKKAIVTLAEGASIDVTSGV